MMELAINDLLEITRETVDWFRDSQWHEQFQMKHIGETVRYGGTRENKENGKHHILAFQMSRGYWCTPKCSLEVIMKMREAYLVTQGEIDNA